MRPNKQVLFVSIFILLTAFCSTAMAQSELPKTEVGIQVTLPIATVNQFLTDTGIGGRLTYNLNEHIAVEGAVSYFPNNLGICDIGAGFCNVRRYEGFGDQRLLGVFGAKAGYRYDKLGLFLKARPGFIQLDKFEGKTTGCVTRIRNLGPDEGPCVSRVNFFAFDTGGVIEFYPSRPLMLRTDLGTALVWQRNAPSRVKGLVQVSIGVGLRF